MDGAALWLAWASGGHTVPLGLCVALMNLENNHAGSNYESAGTAFVTHDGHFYGWCSASDGDNVMLYEKFRPAPLNDDAIKWLKAFARRIINEEGSWADELNAIANDPEVRAWAGES